MYIKIDDVNIWVSRKCTFKPSQKTFIRISEAGRAVCICLLWSFYISDTLIDALHGKQRIYLWRSQLCFKMFGSNSCWACLSFPWYSTSSMLEPLARSRCLYVPTNLLDLVGINKRLQGLGPEQELEARPPYACQFITGRTVATHILYKLARG